MILKKNTNHLFVFYITNKQSNTITPRATRYHIKILKSWVFKYFNKNLIHINPATNEMKTPNIKIEILALINVIVEPFKNVRSTAPATTGADK